MQAQTKGESGCITHVASNGLIFSSKLRAHSWLCRSRASVSSLSIASLRSAALYSNWPFLSAAISARAVRVRAVSTNLVVVFSPCGTERQQPLASSERSLQDMDMYHSSATVHHNALYSGNRRGLCAARKITALQAGGTHQTCTRAHLLRDASAAAAAAPPCPRFRWLRS